MENLKLKYLDKINIQNDKIFKKNRVKFAKQIKTPKLYNFIDHYPLFSGLQNLGQKICIYELFKSTIDIPGHIMEFGCWKGSNLIHLAKLNKILSPNSNKKIIGFDNFEGLPEPSNFDGKRAKNLTGEYKGNLENLRNIIKLFKFQGYVNLVVGDANKTMPKFFESNLQIILSFVYLDFDLFEPTSIALKYVDKVLSKGGLIIFDQANDPNWPGETIAYNNFIEQTKNKYQLISNSFSRQPSLILKKI